MGIHKGGGEELRKLGSESRDALRNKVHTQNIGMGAQVNGDAKGVCGEKLIPVNRCA